jgi:glycosyltransferase involved in cell wall biosynthesis
MRIAFLSTFYPFRGGIAQFNASVYKELERQHDVKAFTFKVQYPAILFPGQTQYVTEADNAIEIDSYRVLNTANPISYLRAAKQIADFEPDILIMKYWMSYFGPSLGTVAKILKKNTKIITILDNVIPHEKRFFDTAFTNYFLKQNSGFVAMSKSVEKDLYSLKSDAKCLFKEHPLYDHFGEKIGKIEACEHLKVNSEKKTLLFFGIIRKYKGLDVLLEAFELLDDTYQLIIAGEAYDDFDTYKNLIDNSKNKENIHLFNRYIGDEEVPKFFSAADVCVLPYRSATQSGITSISYHFELPIIATKVGGLHEIVKHEKTGLIADKCTPELIAARIKDYFDNNKAPKLEANIQQLKEELSWEKFCASLIEFSKTL